MLRMNIGMLNELIMVFINTNYTIYNMETVTFTISSSCNGASFYLWIVSIGIEWVVGIIMQLVMIIW